MEMLDWEISQVSERGITAFTPFSLRSWNEQVTMLIPDDYEALYASVSTGAQVLDFGRNRQNIHRLLDAISFIATATSAEQLDAEYEARKDALIPDGSFHLVRKQRVITGFLHAFKPVEGYFITPILISLNVFVYFMTALVMVFGNGSWWAIDPGVLSTAGANYKALTLFGQPWRLITAEFLHADVIHLFTNMYGIMILGLYLEPMLGKWRFLAVYLFAALGASIGTVYWSDLNSSVGASGALFGLIGFILVLLFHRFIEQHERRSLLISIGIYVLISFSSLFYSQRVDHACHIGGMLTGMLMAQLLYPSLKRPGDRVTAKRTTALAAGVTVTLLLTIFLLLPRDVNTYFSKLERMEYNYALAQGAYNVRSEEARMKWLRHFGIYYMDENLRIMDEVDKLSLSRDSREKNKMLRKMYRLQKNVFAYSYRSLREGHNKYDRQILDALQELNAVRRALHP